MIPGVDRPMRLDVVVLTAMNGHGIALDEHRGVKPWTAGPVDHLSVHDLDINQNEIPFLRRPAEQPVTRVTLWSVPSPRAPANRL